MVAEMSWVYPVGMVVFGIGVFFVSEQPGSRPTKILKRCA